MLDTQAISVVALAIYCGLLVWAAVTDYRRFIIPNHATLGALVLYPAYAATFPDSSLWISSLVAALIFFAVGYLMYAMRTMGAGDAKLLPVVALWSGPPALMAFLLVMILASLVLAALVALQTAAMRARAGEMVGNAGAATAAASSAATRIKRIANELRFVPLLKLQVPYGVAIAAGGIYVSVNAVFTALR